MDTFQIFRIFNPAPENKFCLFSKNRVNNFQSRPCESPKGPLHPQIPCVQWHRAAAGTTRPSRLLHLERC